MPKGYYRGMKTGGSKTSIRSKYKEPKAFKNIRNWSATRTIDGKRFTIHGVSTKKPTKKELDSLRKQGYYVRVVKQKHPQYGYRFAVMKSPIIGKYGILISDKPHKTKKKNKRKK